MSRDRRPRQRDPAERRSTGSPDPLTLLLGLAFIAVLAGVAIWAATTL
jgi:hypothetical protein